MLATYRPVNKTVILFMSHRHLIVTPCFSVFLSSFFFYILLLVFFLIKVYSFYIYIFFFIKRSYFPPCSGVNCCSILARSLRWLVY